MEEYNNKGIFNDILTSTVSMRVASTRGGTFGDQFDCGSVRFEMVDLIDEVNLNVFSAQFARLVTAPTNDDADWVARNGKESIFVVLKEMFPQVSFPVGRRDPFSRLKVECSNLRSVNTSVSGASRDSPS